MPSSNTSFTMSKSSLGVKKDNAITSKPKFDPSAWAEKQKQKIQKAQHLRAQQRSRLIAQGQIIEGSSSNPDDGATVSSPDDGYNFSAYNYNEGQHNMEDNNYLRSPDDVSTAAESYPTTNGDHNYERAYTGESVRPEFDASYLNKFDNTNDYRYGNTKDDYSESGSRSMEPSPADDYDSHMYGRRTYSQNAYNAPEINGDKEQEQSSQLAFTNYNDNTTNTPAISRRPIFRAPVPAELSPDFNKNAAAASIDIKREDADDPDAEANAQWLGMLRGKDNFVSEDPDVFGKAKTPPPKQNSKPKRKEQAGGSVSSQAAKSSKGNIKQKAGGVGNGSSTTNGVPSSGAVVPSGERPQSGYLSSKISAVGVMPEHIQRKLKSRHTRADMTGDDNFEQIPPVPRGRSSEFPVDKIRVGGGSTSVGPTSNGGTNNTNSKLNRTSTIATSKEKRSNTKRENNNMNEYKYNDDDDEKCFRQMYDKNTLRLDHGKRLFAACIQRLREDPDAMPELHEVLPPYKSKQVKVFLRKRPMFEKEQNDFDTASVHASHVTVHNCLYAADLKTPYIQHNTFHLDRCFNEFTDNEPVYDQAAYPLVEHAITGGIGTMFMLGQTGSGKTHTMTAIESFSARDIFSRSPGMTATIQFLEVRNNKIFDLLHESGEKEIRLREVSSGRYELEDAVDLECSQPNELQACMRMGHHRRHTESTNANDTSSRSHALCLINLSSGGKLVLVDCAGTERRKDSAYHTKERQMEGAQINASLHALKECIRHKAESNNVPAHCFRASSLTKLLSDAFRDNGILCIFCTISPLATDTEHSITTLRTGFALTGRPGLYTRVSKQNDLEKFTQKPAPKRLTPVNKWDAQQVQQWIVGMCGPEAANLLPAGTTGHMLVRMTEQRFSQLLNCARKGRKLFDAMRNEIEKTNSYNKTLKPVY